MLLQSRAEQSRAEQDYRETKSSLKRLNFIGITFLELCFVTILLILFFGLLSYLHIISLSPTIQHAPFLLHFFEQEVSPTPLGTSDKSLSLKTYINNTVQPRFLPKAGVHAFSTKELNQLYKITWESKFDSSIIFHASAVYENNQSQLQFETISLNSFFPADRINASQSAQLTKAYFAPAATFTSWHCLPLNTKSSSICEDFTITENGKIGYAVIIPDNNRPNITILSCFIPISSSIFAKTNSCFSIGI